MNQINQINSNLLHVKKSPLGGFRGLSLLLVLLFFFGCKEEGRIDHIDDSAPAPAQVRVTEIINTPGGAVLIYALADDKNLLYVKAEYDIQPGVTREATASYFTDSLFLEGFGNAHTYDVRVYSKGKNGKMSEPVIVQVNPLTPPVMLATKQLRETFGGVAIDIENPGNANLAVVLLADTAKNGYLSELYTFYTSKPKGSYSFRGLDTVPCNFVVYLSDRWNNLSDTIEASLTPWFEEEILKRTWGVYDLPGDAPIMQPYNTQHIWDGITGEGIYTTEWVSLPSLTTWDLGVTAKLSRFKFWPRELYDGWLRGMPKVFEIWGSTAPNPNGSLDESWIPLGRFECVKPSGTGPTVTREDLDFSNAGIDFDFEVSDFAPDPFVPVRYIRFRTLKTFGNTAITYVVFSEMSFWGSIIK